MKKKTSWDTLAAKTSKNNNVCLDSEASLPYIAIKNGCLVVRHRLEGPYPVIIPCPGVKLMVNDQKCTQLTPVSIQDTVDVKVVNERKEGNWSVAISSDGLQAILRITPTLIINRELADLRPTSKLQLAVVEREERFPPLTWNELLQELSRLGINYGIDWEACSRGITTCIEEEIVIAQGTPESPGNDGWVELLFHSDSKLPVTADEEEMMDFRKRYVFTSVVEGEILAIKHLPGLGRPGTSVKGDVLAPPPPKDFILSAGEGVVLTRDGKRAVASRAGRPVAFRYRNMVRVSVLPELVHTGDVDLISGNIAFKGDVLISGDVEGGMEVKASGNIRVGGLVSRARIQAEGAILVRGNILTSVVIAGGVPSYMNEILPHIRTLADGLRKLTMAINQLLGHSGIKQGYYKRDTGPLLKLLLNDKFCYLIEASEALQEQAKMFPPELTSDGLETFIREVERVVLYSPLTVRDLQDVQKLARWALEWEQTLMSPPSTDNSVVASNIINTTVITAGDVKVVGGGCYNSRIQADKKVTVLGVFRGGEIQAGGDVHLGELGSKGGITTRVVTGSDAVVTANSAFENALVSIGGRSYSFMRKENNVRLWLDKEGNLEHSGTPG